MTPPLCLASVLLLSRVLRLSFSLSIESYTRQYVIGRKTWIDVLNAVREATQSQLALEDTHTQVIAVSLRLRAQTGTLKPNEGSKP